MDNNVTLSFDQLPSAVGELLSKVNDIAQRLISIDSKLEIKPVDDKHVLMDIKEAAAFLKREVSTLYAYTSEHKIPFFKRGNTLYFFKDQLLKWIEDGGTYDKPYAPSPAEQADFEAHLAMMQKGKKHKPASLKKDDNQEKDNN